MAEVAQGSVAPGLVCTFYSFKGGVGRSMALANVASLLAKWGSKVLVLDWDLEAPGLEKYFTQLGRPDRRGPGIVDLVTAFAKGEEANWKQGLVRFSVPAGCEIEILHAGRDDGSYQDRLRAISWPDLFQRGLGTVLEELRDEARSAYDFVLIDSRTGYTDSGGICTILLPDVVVSLFTTNEQSLHGVADAMRGAKLAHAQLPLERGKLLIVPVPARDESLTEYARSKEWRARFADKLRPFYDDWIPRTQSAEQVLDYLKIPHVPFWSFGELLPVLEEDAANPKTLAYSYALLARLLRSRCDWSEVREGGRAAADAEARQFEVVEQRTVAVAAIRQRATETELAREDERLAKLREVVANRFAELLQREARAKSSELIWAWLGGAAALSAASAIWLRSDIALITRPAWMITVVVSAAIIVGGLIVTWSRRLVATRVFERLDRENAMFQASADQYGELKTEHALRRFADRIEAIVQMRRLQLDEVPPKTAAPVLVKPALSLSPADSLLLDSVDLRLPDTPAAALPLVPAVARAEETAPTSADVALFYPHTPLSRNWMQEFKPIFSAWVTELLGREPLILDASRAASYEGGSAEHGALGATAFPQTGIRVAVVLLPRRFGRDDGARAGFEDLKRRFGNSLVLMSLEPDAQTDPAVREFNAIDFSDLAYVGEGFAKSERSLQFQDRVRAVAQVTTDLIEDSLSAQSSQTSNKPTSRVWR